MTTTDCVASSLRQTIQERLGDLPASPTPADIAAHLKVIYAHLRSTLNGCDFQGEDEAWGAMEVLRDLIDELAARKSS